MSGSQYFLSMSDISIGRNKNALPRPEWLKVRVRYGDGFHTTKKALSRLSMNTVCEEARCPNIGECWQKGHATIMILGATCTRGCAFCNVNTGKPDTINADEPHNIALLAKEMMLSHIVITSVDRDDLPDGGASHFAACIYEIRELCPEITIEVLTPDFINKGDSYLKVVTAKPDVYNHNIETVARLYPRMKQGGRYFNSLNLLFRVKQHDRAMFTKSGIIVGLGETDDEIFQAMDDLRAAGVDFLTIGQYLQPSKTNAPIDRYVHPDQFEMYKRIALTKGFLMVSSSPLTRSSYHAGDDFIELRRARTTTLAR